MPPRSRRIAALLFVSGLCALLYQVVWLRELRLIFGASTPASGAVLAVFMGGLGFGSLLLSRRADTARRPLMMYANLEAGIAITAAITPGLVLVARWLYVALGGSTTLGGPGSTIVRLLLGALVLVTPTFLMGGTLPAAARAAIGGDDVGRRSIALLYGVNTLGAVTGAFISTFLLLELFGSRITLWIGCLLNALIAVIARVVDRGLLAEEQAAVRADAADPAISATLASAVAEPAPQPVVSVVERVPREPGPSDEEEGRLGATLQSVEDEMAAAHDRYRPIVVGGDMPQAVTLASFGVMADEGENEPAGSAVVSERPAQPAAAPEPPAPSARATPAVVPEHPPAAEPRFVLVAAAVVGFVFLAMELIWYRMLSPLLGGSSYTFGLILAVALLGIGLGGMAYTLRAAGRAPTLRSFAITCGLEALLIALPFALGDRVALLAMFLRDFGAVGLLGHGIAWTMITSLVVLPAAIVSGYQFPLLIALLGRGAHHVGRHVGLAYAFNTLGAIVGSLAGGFFLLPGLGALGAWRALVWLLVGLGLGALWTDAAGRGVRASPAGWASGLITTALAAVMLHGCTGPTSVWRHSPVGAGRADDWTYNTTRNELKRTFVERRRGVTWEADGRESTIALFTLSDTAFLVNGKSDGAAVSDAGTQIMGGLLGALLHPRPVRRALVVGLGTGSTAGWLGKLPGIERVDVVELEPAIRDVAEACTAVNADVLHNPKVNIIIGDAREVLLTMDDKYDLIFSEPSNPYRAGVASLFTREFYDGVVDRLHDDGVFVQWVQAYEIDAKSVRTVFTTLVESFGSVEAWRTKYSDLALVSRRQPQPLDVGVLTERMATEPFKEAMMASWRVDSVEGVLARFVARPSLAHAVWEADREVNVNTDDRNLLEFSVARALGRPEDFTVEGLLTTAASRMEHYPELVGTGAADIDWAAVDDEYLAMRLAELTAPTAPPHRKLTDAHENRMRAQRAWLADKLDVTLREWRQQDREPRNAVELMVVADALAVTGDDAALPYIERLGTMVPLEAEAIRARLWLRQGKPQEALAALERAFVGYRTDPWPNRTLMARTLMMVVSLLRSDHALADRLDALLVEPFSVRMLDYLRHSLRLDMALTLKNAARCVEAIAALGPHYPWERPYLRQRVQCYDLANHPDLDLARDELEAFVNDEGSDFGAGLPRFEPPAGSPTVEVTARPASSASPLASASADAAGSASASPPQSPPADAGTDAAEP